MRLKSVIIDGFKSYAHRQVLNDIDPHFNAITGLNGSGKSNIFDALCFVMGISNLKRVRAEGTCDLIYKNGNAGIQTATVTIEFLNNDVATAPAGYPPSDFPIIRVSRSVAVGGRQKFYLNDRTSDSTKVKHFFQNALLNIDNPHFMVLQGTVHKMMSMKSIEILGLLEEASGTRVFDTRRRAAENLLRSKEKRVQMINEGIDEITPGVNAMLQQKEEYGQFLRAKETFAEKNKFALAYQYWSLKEIAEKKHTELRALQESFESKKKIYSELPSLRERCANVVSSLEDQLKEPLQILDQYKEQKSDTLKEEAKTKSLLNSYEQALKTIQNELKRTESELLYTEKNIQHFEINNSKSLQEYELLKQSLEATQENILKLTESIRLHKNGVQASFNGGGAQDELEKIKKNLISLVGEMRRLKDSLGFLKSDERKYEKELEGAKDIGSSVLEEVELAKKKYEKAQKEFEPFQNSYSQLPGMRQAVQEKREEYSRQMGEALRSNTVSTPLQYVPIPNIDIDSHIYGRLGELLVPRDGQKYTKALTAGTTFAILDRVIVTRDDIAQLLIERGGLRVRTSFLPLNTVTQNPHVINEKRFQAAKEIAAQFNSEMSDSEMGLTNFKKNEDSSFVILASSVIQYDEKFKTIANNTYGTFVICSDLRLAQKLASDPRTKMKAVTIYGDVADPQGIVSGGSTKNLRDLVSEFASASLKKIPLENMKKEICLLEKELHVCEEKCKEGRRQYEEYFRAEEIYQQKVAASDKTMSLEPLMNNLKETRKNIKITEDRITALQKEEEDSKKRMEELVSVLAEDPRKVGQQLENKLKMEQEKTEKIKHLVAEQEERMDKTQEERLLLDQKLVDIREELVTKKNELESKKKENEELQGALGDIEHNLIKLSQLIEEQQTKIKELTEEVEQHKKELQRLDQQKEQTQKLLKDDEAQIKICKREVDHELTKVDQVLRDHPWIRQIQDQLGDEDGVYYFKNKEKTEKMLEEVEILRGILMKSERNMNEKASMMYDEYKQGLDKLLHQRATLVYDKEVILNTIKAVEAKKWKTLDAMFRTVSVIFGKLFSFCLPGASARLVEEREPETQRLTGLAVKVSFNGHDKESLAELSGGQRSLLALCLILALLRVRPAAFYILDEVDAALDPSHTQNIGHMLQTHFPRGQFLLVSLKDGMFNNANVLYEVKNTLGYSQVTRREAKTHRR